MSQLPHSAGSSESPSKTELLDAPLHTIGFKVDKLSPEKVSGHLLITTECCQPFNKLHGGVSALIAEALASMGAYVASGYKRIAGIHLSIHHLKSAQAGDYIYAEATPATRSKSVQVWDVRIWKLDPSTSEKQEMISSGRLTAVSNLPTPESAKGVAQIYQKYSKL
ncbi:1,4-dihydroxy-2-naphthoyl-CoA thioesterase 1-like [Andrographis paniculata]|uniref:1,4-dihydroxy-2-naphthoyl-CoA thioesterase 1-like n=1 Tax=Andrographis paniculata TaxID=175694 RepID=UPI0021E8EEF6|nr:1,4-dihydroxy-2-naphthoyl-CoA thioesterase 1-like [Andrographis paniculata]XP_051143123.1 1,4-dihydroxy-2-naphthoyl-CoA thioesterase 1-like [Andrographis paniculata]XP_051143133.1 1,4-dihydroxy-2-naphthoyl-CoA thioesterase 1-like [Andrographis paniculata]XP_051143141.1 1,4-dihydroxy-2-naphthoyl-CoA thioesterase 1-like [Andrographis paniculata]